MATRRDFLRAGVAVSAFPALASMKQPEAPSGRAPIPFSLTIFDKRFSAGRAFASYVEQFQAPVYGIEGDVTALWYSELSSRWKAGPVAMAGLTLNGALFCLDVLARDHGMRVVFRSEHKQVSDGREIADLVTHFVTDALETPPPVIAVPHLARPHGNPEPLVSWVIIPAGARIT